MAMPSSPEAEASSWQKITTVTLLLIAVIVVFLAAFALPNINSEPRNIPVALAAPEQAVNVIIDALDKAAPDMFEITVTADAEQAHDRILDRSVYGAFIVTQSGLTIETASAASYAVSTTLITVGQQLAKGASLPATVEDVVPFSADDPRGVGLSAGALPIALGGWIAAVGILAMIRGRTQRLITAGGFAVLGGFTLTAVLQFWLGTFTGDYWLTSLGATLGIAATSFLVLGLQGMFDMAGIGIAAVLLILLGNPLSGLASAPELLPVPWGTIGQFLPPGATGTLLRNIAFFDGAATIVPIIVLAVWFLLGLGLYLLSFLRPQNSAAATSTATPATVTAN